jgi:hypothetical protein
MGGWGSLLDRVTSWLPIPKRIERIKNTIDKLERERNDILLHKAEISKANRLTAIDNQLADLRKRLQNSSTE